VKCVGGKLGYSVEMTSSRDLVGDTSGATENIIKRAISSLTSPVVWVLDELQLLARDREGRIDERALLTLKEGLDTLGGEVVVIGVTTDKDKLDPRVVNMFLHPLEIPGLSATDRQEVLVWLLDRIEVRLSEDVKIENLVQRTAGYNLTDLENMIDFALDTMKRDELTVDNFDKALASMVECQSKSLGLATVPSVRWEEVGGLGEAKEELLQAIQPPIPGDLCRSGVLLYGPPGVGKTLLAKAVATECSLNFLSVKGPELLNMYVGQSEENVRQVFKRAREAQPSIIFFDELDSLAPNRGHSGDSGGVMDRVVSALLAELDNLTGVTVIGATNRPDLVDPALLRPGRFDRMVYLGVTSDPNQQLLILTALTKKLNLRSDCDLSLLCPLLPPGLTGADLSSLVSGAAMTSVQRTIENIEAGEEETNPEVVLDDFILALDDLQPSVSQEDLAGYESLRQNLRR